LVGILFCVDVITNQPRAVMAVVFSSQVSENPINKAAAQLKAKEQAINDKEQMLKAMEQKLERGNMFVLLLILVLFLLILLNFYFDYHRRHEEAKK
jgi:hypothetical protein